MSGKIEWESLQSQDGKVFFFFLISFLYFFFFCFTCDRRMLPSRPTTHSDRETSQRGKEKIRSAPLPQYSVCRSPPPFLLGTKNREDPAPWLFARRTNEPSKVTMEWIITLCSVQVQCICTYTASCTCVMYDSFCKSVHIVTRDYWDGCVIGSEDRHFSCQLHQKNDMMLCTC